MSITKEENSAFVVANNQTGTGAEGTQVVVETKTDGTGNANSNSTSNTTTNNTTTTMNSGTMAGTTTTTTTISTSCTIAGGDGNGTANKPGANEHRPYSNSCNNALNETACCRQETTCTGPRGQNVQHGTQAHRAPQVILQVLPSTPTPLEHHNILASDVHRECRMRLTLSSFLFSSLSFSLSLSLSLFFHMVPHIYIYLYRLLFLSTVSSDFWRYDCMAVAFDVYLFFTFVFSPFFLIIFHSFGDRF